MLGYKTVADLERTMSSAEFGEWLAYEKVYGIPDLFFAVARISRALDVAMIGKSRPAEEYVPYFWTPPRPQTVAEQRSIVRAHLAAARSKSSGRV